ncbi:hypothetical protein ATANTOWER_005629 [Ataeniobius toweri]|uniref:Uncharacterized protein n=1 Tax=Ataeniobius toweri TaxID=208326 RepID=A0ABU7BFT5_9TELE|nr:hypothetical protein [Ataeniobius toweri]
MLHIHDAQSCSSSHYSVPFCRFILQYQPALELLQSLNKTSLSVCSCSFRDALYGSVTQCGGPLDFRHKRGKSCVSAHV